MRILSALLTALLLVGPADDLSAQSPDDTLVGEWWGVLSHNGQESRFGVEIRPHGDGLGAVVSLPALDSARMFFGPLSVNGNSLAAGALEMTHDADGQRLRGVLPASLVPVYEIPFELARGGAPPEAASVREIEPREPVWTRATGGPVWAGTTYRAGEVFAGSNDGSVYALDAEDGATKWAFETGGPVRARPEVSGGFVFVTSDAGRLYKLDASDGSEVWCAQLSPPVERPALGAAGSRYDHYASSARIVGDSAYVGTAEGLLLSIDTASGRERWRFQAEDSIVATPSVAGALVYFGSFDNKVYAVDAASGRLEWNHDTGAAVSSTPAIHEDVVIVGSRSYDLLGLQARDGAIAWRFYYWFSWVESSARVSDGVAYVGASDSQKLNAIDARDGRLIWEFDTEGSAWAQPAVSANTVYIGAVGVKDYFVKHAAGFFAVNRETGQPIWTYAPIGESDAAEFGFASSPSVGAGRVYVGGLDGRIYAFEAEPDSRELRSGSDP